MSTHYLVYDDKCPTCVRLAHTIEAASNSKVTLLSIHETTAKSLLDSAYPKGWKFAPYLITTTRRIRASSGFPMTLRLGWLLGPRKAIKAWAQVQKNMGLVGVALLFGRAPVKAFACDPCERGSCGPCSGCRNLCDLLCC